MKTTLAQRINDFNRDLSFSGQLPERIGIMNPFRENPDVLRIADKFYNKYYNDNDKRRFIIGINPGRLGAGATGVPFTDTKRLEEVCGIKVQGMSTHEPSSVFIYKLIERYGGAGKFYSDYYINSACPLGFIRLNDKGKWINYNYYDNKDLYAAVEVFMVEKLKQQIALGLHTETAWVLGKKNAEHLQKINEREKLFGRLVALEHPRFIVQYKAKQMDAYLDDFMRKLV